MVTFKWRRLSVFLLCFFSVSLFWVSSTSAKIKHIDLDLEPDEIAMTFFNLPEGEALLIQNGTRNVLINSGGPKSYQTLQKQLDLYNVKTIQTLILTNHRLDFRSHVSDLVNQYHVSSILTSGPIKSNLLNPDIPFSITQTWKSTKGITLLPDLVVLKQSQSPAGDINFEVNYGKNSMLYLEDQKWYEHTNQGHEKVGEARMIKLADYGQVAFQTPQLLDKINPEVAIVYQKKGQEFDEGLLEQLTKQMTETYNISQVGNLTFKLTKDNYESMTLHDGSGEP